MLVSGYRSSRVWRIQMAHLAFHTCFCNFCGQSGKNTVDSAEKYKKRKNKLKDMRLCKRWRRPISKRFIKPPYSISRAASIDSDCCRLPTTSVLSKMGQSHPLPSFIRNTSLQRFPLVDVVPSWRLPYLVLTILLCLYRTNPHSSDISDFLYFSVKPMTTSLVTNSQVFGVRLEYWIGVNPRVVVAPFARRHLWCIWAAVSVGSQCVVARFAREHLWGNYAAISVGSQCVVARFARRHLRGICAAVSVGSQCVVDRFAHRHLTGI